MGGEGRVLVLRTLSNSSGLGHLQRVKRQSGDRWRAKWRDAANVEHLKVLGRVLIRRGRAPGLSGPRGFDCCFRTHALLARCEPRRARLVQTQVSGVWIRARASRA